MKLSEIIVAALFAGILMITQTGCEQEGPAEEAGEEIDEQVEQTGDAIEDTTDRDNR